MPARSWLADPQTGDVGDHRHDRVVGDRLLPASSTSRAFRIFRAISTRRQRSTAPAAGGASGRSPPPLLRPVLLFVMVTHVIGSFQLFGQVFVLTGGRPRRRHAHRRAAPLRDRVPELLPVRRRLGDGVGAVRHRCWRSVLAVPLCSAATPSTERVTATGPAPGPSSAGWSSPCALVTLDARSGCVPVVGARHLAQARPRTSSALPPEWIPWPATAGHYRRCCSAPARTARIGRAFLNSLVVAIGTVILVVTTAAMAAYPAGADALPRTRPRLRAPASAA